LPFYFSALVSVIAGLDSGSGVITFSGVYFDYDLPFPFFGDYGSGELSLSLF